ncbi:MAG: hypothetical protein J0I06_02275 [Planctomycetes bacterium]|nr:hypothetical protein [Planctomycetota bacterium]
MAQAKWYSLTPARQQLLVALVIAVLVFVAMLSNQIDRAAALRDVGKPDEPANGPMQK